MQMVFSAPRAPEGLEQFPINAQPGIRAEEGELRG